MADLAGKTISHYKILEKLGESGMGVVYKAEDTKLKRIVALKFLPPYLTDDPEANTRFIQEAQTASALDHNNICTIHEIGETSDGQMYIVMTYYEGENLKKKIKHGSLELEHILHYAIQVAEGLQKVHEKGIVHRDIKSANIMITLDGVAKILDFGLAKLTGRAGITKTGSTLGTVAYMSPEQAQGLKLDHRTDIWSLGVVMYEMLTGQMPFKSDCDQVVIYSIVNEDYTPITEIRSDVWVELEQVVANALQKDSSDRYQSMNELLIDLKSLNKKIDSSQSEVAIVRKATLPSIAVLPFLDMSPKKDQDYFCEGIAEELINALTKIEKLRVASRTSSFQFKGKSHNVHKIGKELNVKTVLEGSIRKAGNKLRITAQLVNTNNGYHLWSEKYDRDMEDIFAIQDEISLAIVDKLKLELLGDEKARLVKRYTENQEAHNLYLKGLYFWDRQHEGGYLKSMEYFQQAIEQDALYALPYTGIANAFTFLGLYGFLPAREAYMKARSAAMKALDIDDTLAEAHLAMAKINFWFDWNWFYADKEYKRTIELKANFALALMEYSIVLSLMGKTDESIEKAKRAQQLDPLSLYINSLLVAVFFITRHYDEALEQASKTIEMDENFTFLYFHQGMAYLSKGLYQEAVAAFQKLLTLTGEVPFSIALLGSAHGPAGQKDEALKMLERLNELSKITSFSAFYYALIYMGLGEMDQAFECLEKAYMEAEPWLAICGFSPYLDPLRSDPRFPELLKKLDLKNNGNEQLN